MAGSTSFKAGTSFALRGRLVVRPGSRAGQALGGLTSKTGLVLKPGQKPTPKPAA